MVSEVDKDTDWIRGTGASLEGSVVAPLQQVELKAIIRVKGVAPPLQVWR